VGRIQNTAILKQLPIHFKGKREKGVGTPFPRVPAPLHPCLNANMLRTIPTMEKFISTPENVKYIPRTLLL